MEKQQLNNFLLCSFFDVEDVDDDDGVDVAAHVEGQNSERYRK